MFKNLTYRKKIRFLAIGVVILTFIIYNLSIKKTIILKKECKSFEEKLALVEYAPQKIALLEKELSKIEGIIGKSDTTCIDFQQILLEKTSNYCQENNIILKEFPKQIINEQQDYIIETNIVVLEGGFITLLKFLYLLEQKYNIGKVVSAGYNAFKDIKTKKYKLNLTIYVQNIKKKEL